MKKIILMSVFMITSLFSKDYDVTKVISIYGGYHYDDYFLLKVDLNCNEEISCKGIPIMARRNENDTRIPNNLFDSLNSSKYKEGEGKKFINEFLKRKNKFIEFRNVKRGENILIGDLYLVYHGNRQEQGYEFNVIEKWTEVNEKLAISLDSKKYIITKIISVYDGDTFRADLDCQEEIFCKNIPIRLKGIDAPEMKGKCKKEKALAIKARDYLRGKLEDEDEIIELRNIERGKYFRIVGDLYVGDINISLFMSYKNLVTIYDGGKKTKDWCNLSNK